MSASSGICVADEVVTTYNDLQLKHLYSYEIFKINDGLNEVINDCQSEKVEKPKGAPPLSQEDQERLFEEFMGKLPEKDCRYAVLDVKFDTQDGTRDKICFIVWCPDDAPIKKKMIYASTKDTLKRKLTGLHAEFQADCKSDMKFCDVLDKVKKAK